LLKNVKVIYWTVFVSSDKNILCIEECGGCTEQNDGAENVYLMWEDSSEQYLVDYICRRYTRSDTVTRLTRK